MINSIDDINNFINDKSFKKIYILSGKKSFKTSGALDFFDKISPNKNIKIHYKYSEIPILEELIEITNSIKSFKPDLILAIGGGAVIDYGTYLSFV